MNLDEMVRDPAATAPARRGLEFRKRPDIVVGGLPTVSLLPSELRNAAREKSVRRALVAAVVVALVVVGGATAGAAAVSGAAQSRLDLANAETQTLLGQLGKFRDVQALQQDILLGKAAVKVGSSTEIDWQQQLEAIEADMPGDFTITSVQADGATPTLDYPQGTSPLDRPRAASMTLGVTAPDASLLPRWLRKLRSLPAYADATASVTSDGASGYIVQVVLHLSPKALISGAKVAK
jgi:Tfp pilus assembly protein PilN